MTPAHSASTIAAKAYLLGLVLAASAPQGATAAAVPAVALEVLADGLPPLSSAASAGDERLFLTTIDGRILIFQGGAVLAEPFLDLRPQVLAGFEGGLLSVAFHPRYAENGYFFVYYSDTAARPVLARYSVSPEDRDRALPESAAVLLRPVHPDPSHYGGQLQFGPDGYLYVGIGDGGDHYDPFCNAQRLDQLGGKLLRLDVDGKAEVEPYYTIPPTNPFVDTDGARGEIWALGFRNPWRFAFDRIGGDLYVGDVGESAVEEIDFQPAASLGGENYGWARQEGSLCVDRVESCPFAVPACGDPALTPPILEYEASPLTCNAAIAGYVYRGSAIPGLAGSFIFGDYCSGVIRAARKDGSGVWNSVDLGVALSPLTSFGQDAAGEIYVTTRHGVLARLVSAQVPGCSRDRNTLCLAAGRFRVDARFTPPGGESRRAAAVTLSDDTGYFWFFDRANVELVVKVLDGCSSPLLTQWVFAAGLTNLDVSLTVTEVATGAIRRYHNAAGQAFPVIQDTVAFPCR